MADFYVKYGSINAKLIGNFNFGSKLHIKLHDVGPRFVISKNRKIICEYVVFEDALKAFMNIIFLEDPSSLLFNS